MDSLRSPLTPDVRHGCAAQSSALAASRHHHPSSRPGTPSAHRLNVDDSRCGHTKSDHRVENPGAGGSSPQLQSRLSATFRASTTPSSIPDLAFQQPAGSCSPTPGCSRLSAPPPGAAPPGRSGRPSVTSTSRIPNVPRCLTATCSPWASRFSATRRPSEAFGAPCPRKGRSHPRPPAAIASRSPSLGISRAADGSRRHLPNSAKSHA